MLCQIYECGSSWSGGFLGTYIVSTKHLPPTVPRIFSDDEGLPPDPSGIMTENLILHCVPFVDLSELVPPFFERIILKLEEAAREMMIGSQDGVANDEQGSKESVGNDPTPSSISIQGLGPEQGYFEGEDALLIIKRAAELAKSDGLNIDIVSHEGNPNLRISSPENFIVFSVDVILSFVSDVPTGTNLSKKPLEIFIPRNRILSRTEIVAIDNAAKLEGLTYVYVPSEELAIGVSKKLSQDKKIILIDLKTGASSKVPANVMNNNILFLMEDDFYLIDTHSCELHKALLPFPVEIILEDLRKGF